MEYGDSIVDFNIDLNKWVKPLNVYTDGIVAGIVNNLKNTFPASDECAYEILPFGSQNYDYALNATVPLDIYIVNRSAYYYDLPKGADENNFDIKHKDIDYKGYRNKIYKILQKRYTKQNVGLRNICK